MTEHYAEGDGWTLWHADALTALPSIPWAGCVILDPPYHMSPSTFRGIDDGAASSVATPVRLLTEAFRETYRLLPNGGVAFIFCDWRRGPDTTYLATLAGLRISTCVAWTRNRPGTGGMFRGAWDPIYVASKGVPNVVDRAAVPNVVAADHPIGREHPYEKPGRVWHHLLSRIPQTTVVDAFAGSGSRSRSRPYLGRHRGRRAPLRIHRQPTRAGCARLRGRVMTEESSALDRLDPGSRNQWGLPSRAAGPTAADHEDRIAQLERENAALRRALHDNEEQRLSLLRAAEARDRGPVTTNDPRERPQP